MKKQVAAVTLSVRTAMLVLLGAVGFLLVIGCLNIANLLLVRTTKREREMSIRAAIGASRGRLVRQALVESLMISSAGGALGLLIAAWSTDVLITLLPASTLSFIAGHLQIDARIFAFAAGLAVLTGIAFGIVPAVRASRPSVDAVRRAGGGHSFGRTPSLLVVTEVVLAVVLLVGAALMARTFAKLNAIDPGFDPNGFMSVTVSARLSSYPTLQTRASLAATLAREIAALPNVESVSIADGLPGNSGFSFGTPEVLGSGPVGSNPITLASSTVDAAYFQTLRIPLVAGRIFEEEDGPNAVIINKAFADYLWPGRGAVGGTFRPFAPVRPTPLPAGIPGSWSTVVGVVGNIETRLGEQTLAMQMYYPFVAHPRAAAGTPAGSSGPQPPGGAARRYLYRTLIVRAADLSSVAPAIKARARAVDPSAVVTQLSLASDVYADFFAPQRFALVMMSLFSAIACSTPRQASSSCCHSRWWRAHARSESALRSALLPRTSLG